MRITMRTRTWAMASVFFLTCGLFQTQADSQRASEDRVAAFDAASIKRRVPGGPTVEMLMLVTPGRIHFQAVTLKDCIRWAYGLADYQVSGGPQWIERSEEHTSELQSQSNLVCRLLLEKKKHLQLDAH